MRRQPVSYSEQLAQVMRELTSKKSYRQIAKDAEISPSTIGNMVLGRIPSEEICIKVANAANSDPDILLLACGYEPQPPPAERAAEALSQIDDPIQAVTLALRSPSFDDLSELAKTQILDFVREIESKAKEVKAQGDKDENKKKPRS